MSTRKEALDLLGQFLMQQVRDQAITQFENVLTASWSIPKFYEQQKILLSSLPSNLNLSAVTSLRRLTILLHLF